MVKAVISIHEADRILSEGLDQTDYRKVSRLFADSRIVREFVARLVRNTWSRKLDSSKAVRILNVPLIPRDKMNQPIFPTWPLIIAEIVRRCLENGIYTSAIHALQETSGSEELAEYRIEETVERLLADMGIKMDGLLSSQIHSQPQTIAVPVVGGPQPTHPSNQKGGGKIFQPTGQTKP
jgi:hypothetical protein